MQNEAQYDLDRKAAKISALSSNNLDNYEYLTGEDLGFNKGLSKDDKKERLFKRLENIKDKNEKKLQAIEDQGKKQLYAIKNINISSKPLKTIGFF